MEETLRLILAELQAIRLILDRDTGADAMPIAPRSFSTARFIITERPDWQDDGKANADQG